ncbi:MAG: glycosyltransferase family 39 protein [bacterium]|nr:glycosyltransferase family 39 protein [bacterium]
MSNRLTNIIAACLLIFMFFLAFFSMKDDSATMDEVAHLPAGYSYLTQKDMRLNPEHPPLIKDLAALPLLFIKGINFPSEIKDWKEDINGQWGFGYHFLYGDGNPTDKMIFWGRIPMVLILILLGFYIFKWAKELFGNKAAVLSLFLFSFSPTFLAHGRLVTTDVGAAAGVLIATYYFIKALKNPSKKSIIFAGIAFGLAELCKFSVILLIPFFAFLSLTWWLVKLGNLKRTLKILILVFIIGYILIWPVYQYHVWNYPKEKQASDTEFLLSSHLIKSSGPILSWAAEKPILRPYAQYLLGLFLVFQRAAFGHTTYFLGEISAAGWKNYFPIVYLIKETLVFHILTLIALLYAAWLIKKPFWQNTFQRLKGWIRNHFPEFAMLSFIGIYWITSLTSDLNIGVRHLLPVFPFTMLLVGATIIKLLKAPFLKIKYLILGGLILWQVFSIVSIYPHFLAYFNELAGGPNQGFVYTVDSNLDWGQDLKRLKKWVDENKIDKIYVDYFGGGDTKYYLKEKYAPWQGTQDPNEFPKENYLAVSATFLQGGRGLPAPGFNQPWGYYLWLNKYQPIAKIGYSIFVYYIK